MNDIDRLAERHRTHDGQPLADYLPLSLPCYVLQVDILLVGRRRLMPVEEYALRTVREGLSAPDDVCAFLGLADSYGKNLIARLIDDEFLALVDAKGLCLRSKANEALTQDGEERLFERSMSVLWDPISKNILTNRVTLMSSKELQSEDRPKVVPQHLQLPSAIDLSVADIQILRSALPSRESPDEVIRCVEVRRPTLKYRSGLLLVFGGDSTTSSAPVARIAVEGDIDDTYSSAFLNNGFPELLGIDRSFYRRAGTQVVNQRVRKIGVGNSKERTYGEVLQKRSTLRLSIDVLEKSDLGDNEASLQKIENKKAELQEIEKSLASIPFRPLLPFEVAHQLDELISKSKHRVLITSSMPHPLKCSNLFFLMLEGALRRRVEVRILISDRPEADFLLSKNEKWRPLRRLSELADKYANLDVGFLKDINRTIFEIHCDESRLLVSNEPSMGERPMAHLVRCFAGFAISGKPQVSVYAEEFLTPDNLAVVQQLRYQKPKDHKAEQSTNLRTLVAKFSEAKRKQGKPRR